MTNEEEFKKEHRVIYGYTPDTRIFLFTRYSGLESLLTYFSLTRQTVYTAIYLLGLYSLKTLFNIPRWMEKHILKGIGQFLVYLKEYVEFWKEQEKYFEAEANAEELIYNFAREKRSFGVEELIKHFESAFLLDRERIMETVMKLIEQKKIRHVTLFDLEVVDEDV